MSRHQSEKMKRRAALATLLSLIAFMFCLFGTLAGERARANSHNHEWARSSIQPYVQKLGSTAKPDEWQQLLQNLVRREGPVIAAVVVDRKRRIAAALPSRT